MKIWLTETRGLTVAESTLVRSLYNAASRSIEDFDLARRVVMNPGFFPTLIGAIAKARAQGLLKEW